MSQHLRKIVTNVLLRDKWLKSEGKYTTNCPFDLAIVLAELRAEASESITQKHEAFKRANSKSNS